MKKIALLLFIFSYISCKKEPVSIAFDNSIIKDTILNVITCGSSSVGRAPAFQAGCREFEPRLPLYKKALHLQGFFLFQFV